MKKFLWVCSVVVVLACVFYYTIFYSYWVPSFALSFWLKRNAPTVQLQTFTYQKRSAPSLSRLGFENFNLVLKKEGVTHVFNGKIITIESNRQLFASQQILTLVLKNVNLNSTVQLNGIEAEIRFNLSDHKVIDLKGKSSAVAFSAGENHLESLQTDLTGNRNAIRLSDFKADGYGGEIRGDFSITDFSMLSYAAQFDIKDVDLRLMRAVNEGVFSQMQGRATGKINIEGNGKQMNTVTADLDVSQGATIKAALLGLLANYLPQSIQKKELQQLIDADSYVPLERAHLHLKNDGQEKLNTTVNLGSQKLNLDMNVGVDINLGTTLADLSKVLVTNFFPTTSDKNKKFLGRMGW